MNDLSPNDAPFNANTEAEKLDAVKEEYEERAAILEYDAGMNREDAERLARVLTGYQGW